MPSGRYLTAHVWCYGGECAMNVVLFALSEDRVVSRGLCGNYDGARTNDLTQAGLSSPVYPPEPIVFSKHFQSVLYRYFPCSCRILFISRYAIHLVRGFHTECDVLMKFARQLLNHVEKQQILL